MLKVTPNLMIDATCDGRNQCALIGRKVVLRGFVYEIKLEGARARHLCADMQF